MYRQGDVLIIPVRSIPEACKEMKLENGRVVLAHGEVTGHAHAIGRREAVMFRDSVGGAGTFIKVGDKGAQVKHEEHSTIALAPGNYEIVRQREYSPEAIRNVAD